MNCHYCRAQNGADDHRCSRCGRRLTDSPRSVEMFPVQQGAAAHAIDALAVGEGEIIPVSGPQPVNEIRRVEPAARIPIQAPLFGPQGVQPLPQPPRRASRGPSKPPRDYEAQRLLNLEGTRDGARTLATSVEAAVWCNAPVAIAPHRIMACLADTSLCLAGFAVFLATLFFAGVPFQLSKVSLGIYAAAFGGVYTLYRLLYCLAQADSVGLQFSGLRLLNFDGQQPSRRQRLLRICGGAVSLISAGIGLAWTAVDEERLSWHDHISQTFPTPRD